MRRFFLAIQPKGLSEQSEFLNLRSKLERTTRERETDCRYTPLELLHMTLIFLGAGDEEYAQRCQTAFQEWPASGLSPLLLRVQGMGAFPNEREARVIWLGVRGTRDLLDFQAALAAHFAQYGFPPDERPFLPHITMIRFRNPCHVGDLLQLGMRKRFGKYPAASVILFESVLQGHVAKYLPLAQKDLSLA